MVLFKDSDGFTPEELDQIDVDIPMPISYDEQELWRGIKTEHLRIDGLQDYISGLEHQLKEQSKRIDELESTLQGHKDCISAHDFNIGGNQKPKEEIE